MLNLLATQLPQLSDELSLTPTISSIMVSWTPPQFAPDSYNISYSCQLLCHSELYPSSSDTVNGTATTHTITSLNAGSNCTVSVTAVFGSNSSNTVTSSTNTTSAGILQHSVTLSLNILLIQFLVQCLVCQPPQEWYSSSSNGVLPLSPMEPSLLMKCVPTAVECSATQTHQTHSTY